MREHTTANIKKPKKMLYNFCFRIFFSIFFLQAISLLDFQKQRTDNNTVVSMTDCALCKY